MPDVVDIQPPYLHPHGAANERVVLHDGAVVLRHGKGTADGTGTLALRWLPSTGLRLEVDITAGAAPRPGGHLKIELAGTVADGLATSHQQGFADGVSFEKVAVILSSIELGTGDPLSSIGFQIVNFPSFLTPGPKPAPVFGFPPKTACLQCAGWRIDLTAVQGSKAIFESLDETGGYAFTHLGRLERDDRSAFSTADAEPVLAALTALVSFARGAACSLPIRWGTGTDGAVLWESWGSPIVDAWREPHTWFDEHHGNLLSELFPTFFQTHTDATLGEPLKLALHWYQKCNTRAGGMEGSVILGLTALDLLGALVVVERARAMGASKYDALPAATKLSTLLQTMNVPSAIPAKLTNLAAFAATNGWSDAATALAEIRHGYVHANAKRRRIVLSAPNLAIFEAWQLSLWYLELSLLYLLNHKGQYRNRLTAEWLGIVEPMPWV